MADVSGYLLSKLKDHPRLRAVPPPVVEEIINISIATLYELLASQSESTLDDLICSEQHEICHECDAVVKSRLVMIEEVTFLSKQEPTRCLPCWNKHCDAKHQPQDKRCEYCGDQLPCEDRTCPGAVEVQRS